MKLKKGEFYTLKYTNWNGEIITDLVILGVKYNKFKVILANNNIYYKIGEEYHYEAWSRNEDTKEGRLKQLKHKD